jgi:hypothetical protein
LNPGTYRPTALVIVGSRHASGYGVPRSATSAQAFHRNPTLLPN